MVEVVEANGRMAGESLRQLQEQHRRYSQLLESLVSKPYLSEDEKLEEVRLKKIKLRLKDEISGLLSTQKRIDSIA